MVGLIVIIALHAAIRPHQKSWHNIVDIFILSDIAIIYALSLYIYVQATDLNQMVENSRAISVAITIRLLLIYLPLVYAILYISVLISKHVKERILKTREHSRSINIAEENELLPARLVNPGEYMPFDQCIQ